MPPIFRKLIGEKNDQDHYQFIPDNRFRINY
jgi:hypothetical protein